jgi:hypothetical protein
VVRSSAASDVYKRQDYRQALTADERRDLIKFLSRQSARGEQ